MIHCTLLYDKRRLAIMADLQALIFLHLDGFTVIFPFDPFTSRGRNQRQNSISARTLFQAAYAVGLESVPGQSMVHFFLSVKTDPKHSRKLSRSK